MKKGRDFLDLDRCDPTTLKSIIASARRLKKAPLAFQPFQGQTLAMIFEKPSIRTRVSFEVGIRQLGGEALNLTNAEIQIGQRESVADIARLLPRYVEMIMVRTFDERHLHTLADYASVPVINGLTDQTHPCQVMADVMAAEEHLGTLAGRHVVWCGDGDNNVLNSWLHAVVAWGLRLTVICPPELAPQPARLEVARKAGVSVTVTSDVNAARGGDIVLTDAWASMHHKDVERRRELLRPYRVDAALMDKAGAASVFMHCLPAHRGEEVTDEVMDGPHSIIWDEAENRLHAQKAVMCWCQGVTVPANL